MALINFMGGIGAAAEGYNKGAREQRADNKQVDVDAYDAKVRDINTSQLPLAAEAKRLQLENEATDSRNAAELKPVQQQAKKTEAQSAADLAPGKAEADKNQQLLDAKMFAFKQSEAVHEGEKKAEVAQEDMRARIGQHVADGDMASAQALIEQAYASPKIFPALTGKSLPASTALGQAPQGALDVSGQPVTGQALVMKMQDGSTQYLPTSFFSAALQRRQAADNLKAQVIVPQGAGVFNTRTRKFDGVNDNGFIQDGTNPDGSQRWIKPGHGVGSKTEDISKQISSAWDRFNTGDAKLSPDQLGIGFRLTEQLVTDSGGKIKPSLAAEIAYNVTKNPKLIQPSIDHRTGEIVGAYNHPTLGEFKIDPSTASARNPGDFTPEQMKSMANKYVKDMPVQDKDEVVGAAFDQAKTAAMMTKVYASIDAEAAKRRLANPTITAEQSAAWVTQTQAATQQSVQKKLDLISMYADKPKGKTVAPAALSVGRAGNAAASTVGPGVGGQTAPAQAPTLSPALADQIRTENIEMNKGSRMQYSPEVKVYLDQVKAIKDDATNAASKAARDEAARQAIERGRGLSQASQSLAAPR